MLNPGVYLIVYNIFFKGDSKPLQHKDVFVIRLGEFTTAERCVYNRLRRSVLFPDIMDYHIVKVYKRMSKEY